MKSIVYLISALVIFCAAEDTQAQMFKRGARMQSAAGQFQAGGQSERFERMQSFIAEQRAEFVRSLQLSEAQRARLDALQERQRAEAQAHRQAMQALREQLVPVTSDALALHALHAQYVQLSELELQRKHALQREFIAFYLELNPTQQAQIATQLQRWFGRAEAREFRQER
jgi:hypothetical protein